MKALIVNRVGDFALSLGIFAIFFVFGAVDYSTTFATSSYFASVVPTSSNFPFDIPFDFLTFISILLFLGAVGKSAQIGLHT